MPFDFKKYDAKCATLGADALQREWEHYTRLISGAATSTAVSGVAIPFTLGVSTIGVGLAAPAIHNARKKREIIERHLQRHGRTHHTRKRDVITASAISGTVGVVTLGLAPVGADAICNSAAEHGIAYVAENQLGVEVLTHLGLNAAGIAAEESHMHSKKEQEEWRAYSQAIREGKNPPLPKSHIHVPVTASNQSFGVHPVDSNTSFQTAAPSIHVIPPSQQRPFAEAAVQHFPPPPGQPNLNVSSPLHRRHSTSTLSCDASQKSSEQSQPQFDTHLMYGTTTAISAPMVGGQNYCIQLPPPLSNLPSRPSSAIGGGSPSEKLVNHPSKISVPPQKVPVFPPPSPLPQQLHQPEGPTNRPNQTQTQRPRACSVVSFNESPNQEAHQQTQISNGTSQLSLQPALPQRPPSATMSSSSTLIPENPMVHVPAQQQTYTYQPQHNNNASSTNRWTRSTQYNPSVYAKPPPPPLSQQQQQQSYHAPPQLVYSPQDWQQQSSNQKMPLVHHYPLESPRTPVENQQYFTTPAPRSTCSYLQATTAEQQFPHFAPPPAYY